VEKEEAVFEVAEEARVELDEEVEMRGRDGTTAAAEETGEYDDDE
jgi:hypothetical protein